MKKPTIKTAAGTNFHGSGQVGKRQSLFTVTPGVDLADALNSASDLLDTMRGAIYTAAMGEQPLQDNHAWLVLHTLDSAKAVIDSLWKAAEEAEDVASAEQPPQE
jgi:hypothetical protein